MRTELHEPTKEEMGIRISEVIAASRLTNIAFAEMMGTTPTDVSRWKQGRSITAGLPIRIANRVAGRGFLTIPPSQIRDFIECQIDSLPLRATVSAYMSYLAQVAA